jgi:hypothetical protein
MLIKLLVLAVNLFYGFLLLRRIFGKPAAAASETPVTHTRGMQRSEALQIFGVSEHATREEIQESYHRLMKKLHPDHGGSEYFAARLNQARDVLLKQSH